MVRWQGENVTCSSNRFGEIEAWNQPAGRGHQGCIMVKEIFLNAETPKQRWGMCGHELWSSSRSTVCVVGGVRQYWPDDPNSRILPKFCLLCISSIFRDRATTPCHPPVSLRCRGSGFHIRDSRRPALSGSAFKSFQLILSGDVEIPLTTSCLTIGLRSFATPGF